MPSSTAYLFLLAGMFLATPHLVAGDAKPPVVAGFERFHRGDADLAAGGRLLINELGCASCHAPSEPTAKRQAPVLDDVGGRVRVGYLRKYLASPRKTKPGSTMPGVLRDDPEKDQKVEALVQFLASTGSPRHERPSPKALTQGKDLYHKVGCVACHGTRDARGKPETVWPTSVPMSDLEVKYTVPSLTALLTDPLHARPSGRMPRLLTAPEAKAVASFLLQGLTVPPTGKGTTRFSYYEGTWETLPDFASLKPKATGVVNGFDIGIAARESNYAFKFEAILPVDREAEYSFSLSSDDGSKLWIDGKLVVDNDGLHATTSKLGKVKLTKGIHKVVVGFFQAGGGAELVALVSTPGQGEVNMGELVAADEETLKKKPEAVKKGDDAIEIRPELVARGKELFGSLGCASCHQLKVDGKVIESSLKAPPLAKLTADKGCLTDKPAQGLPHFGLDAHQRKAIAVALGTKPTAPIRETMNALNCYACHTRDKVGGATEDTNKHFQTTQPEMGDEGRLPPPLDGVGAKLKDDYFRHLLDRGGHDRPYMHTRMPGFGLANAGDLPAAFAALDKLPAIPAVTFADAPAKVKAQARHLAGGLALGCIKCHTFNGVKAEGVQGIDMTLMPRRLKRDWFHAYIAEPQEVRPGTRMPSSFLKGKSVLPDVLDGTARGQIEAMWLYLNDGPNARPPVGIGQVSIPLVPFGNAILYRGFIDGGGTRAIAVGYPEKAHLAFDANELRLAMLWQGAFLDAAKHWTDRGSGFEGPLGDNVLKLPAGVSFAVLEKAESPWPAESAKKLGYRFGGYRLTPDERPTFLYRLGDVSVEDFPNPMPVGKEVGLKRLLTLTATKPIDNLYYRAAVGSKVEAIGDGWYRIDGAWKLKVPDAKTRPSGGKTELLVPARFKGGTTRIEVEYVW